MARFRVGQRVKKVQGLFVGATGVVACYDFDDDRPLGVRIDCAGVGLDWDNEPRPFTASEVVFGNEYEWEPIIEAHHEACDEDFKRSMDDLLAGVEGVRA
jgi:hypothetical protein